MIKLRKNENNKERRITCIVCLNCTKSHPLREGGEQKKKLLRKVGR